MSSLTRRNSSPNWVVAPGRDALYLAELELRIYGFDGHGEAEFLIEQCKGFAQTSVGDRLLRSFADSHALEFGLQIGEHKIDGDFEIVIRHASQSVSDAGKVGFHFAADIQPAHNPDRKNSLMVMTGGRDEIMSALKAQREQRDVGIKLRPIEPTDLDRNIWRGSVPTTDADGDTFEPQYGWGSYGKPERMSAPVNARCSTLDPASPSGSGTGPGCELCRPHGRPGWIELAMTWSRCDCNPE